MEKNFKDILVEAIEKRKDFTEKLLKTDTDCWRILNGESDSRPGLTIDRYGSLILVQNFYDKVTEDELTLIKNIIDPEYDENFFYVLKTRENKKSEILPFGTDKEIPGTIVCRERGVKFNISPMHRGLDPDLFLDMRVVRDYIEDKVKGLSFLNLFAYTCTVGIKASACRAREVWNIDFSQSALNKGMKNRDINGLSSKKIEFFKEDVIAATRQFSGLGIKGKARRSSFLRFKPRKFDFIFLDPPTFSKGKFGNVDIEKDYQTIFKPALLSLENGGTIIATNHLNTVDMDTWINLLKRASLKAGKEIKNIEFLKPHQDFPSKDENHPLKIAALTIA